jgi:hypothetical protein
MSPFVACCLLPASAIARCCWFKPCVLSLCQLNLYIHNSTLPHALIRALRSSTLIRFLSVFPLALSVICFSNVVPSISRLSTRAPPAAIDALCSLLFLMSCRASYVCALCYDRCALDVFSELIWPPYGVLTFVISGLQHLSPRRRIFPIELHGKLQNGAKLRFLVRFSPEMSRSTQN